MTRVALLHDKAGVLRRGSCRIDRRAERPAKLRIAIFILLCCLQLLSAVSCGNGGASSLVEARAAIQAGDLDRAEAILRRAIKRDPRDTRAAVTLGRMFFESGRTPEANAVLAAVPEDARVSPSYRVLETRIDIALGRLDRAAGHMAALDKAGGAPQVMRDELFRAIALRPDLHADTLRRFGPKWRSRLLDIVVREGLLDRAATLAANLDLDADQDRAAVKKLAMALSLKGQDDQAFRVLTSIPIDPSDPEFVRSLVRLHIRLLHFGRAAKALLGIEDSEDREELKDELLRSVSTQMQRAKRAWRHYPPTWRASLADILMERSELLEAAVVLRTLKPGGKVREQAIHRLLALQMSISLPQLLAPDDPLLGKPITPEKLLARHRALVIAGRWDLAAATEEEFFRRFPKNPGSFDLVLAKARRLVRSGRYREGLDAARAAIRLDPTRAEPLIEEGLALRGLHLKAEADRVLRMALLITPNDPGLRDLLGLSRDAKETGTFSLRFDSAGAGSSGK